MGPLRACLITLALCGCKADPPPATPAPDAMAVVDAAPADAALPKIKFVAQAMVIEIEDMGVPDTAKEPAKPKRRASPRPKRAPKKRVTKASGKRASMMATIRKNMRDVEHCYGRVALKDPSIAGRIIVQWTVGKDGLPTATALLKDTLKDKSVGRCIRSKARKWRFPKPSGGVQVVTYPFDLRVQ